MMAIRHEFTSKKADGPDDTLIQPSDWNADHTIEDGAVGLTKLSAAGTRSATTFLRGDATWAAPAGAGGGGGHPGTLYVRPDGDNDDDGMTWDTAKQTIQAAHDAFMPSEHGQIVLSRGDHVANGVVLSRRVKITGAGPRTTRLVIDRVGAIALTVHFDGTVLRDFEIQDHVSGGHAGGGLLVDDAQDCTFDSLWFNEIGKDAASGRGFNTGPYAVRVIGGGTFPDWNKYVNLRMRHNYRGFCLGAGNGFIDNVAVYGHQGQQEAVYVRRGAIGLTYYWSNVWCAGGPYDGYQIRIESTDDNKSTGQSFVNLNLELSHVARGRHFIWCGGRGNWFEHVRFVGGGWVDESNEADPSLAPWVPPEAIRFPNDAEGPYGSLNVVGVHRTSQMYGHDYPSFNATNENNAIIWQPADYTGVPTVP